MMHGSTEKQLKAIKGLVEELQMELKADQKHKSLDVFKRIIAACRDLDERYKEYCEGCDEDFGYEKGTSYNEGVNMEFYIEASDWHEISLALRELAK